MTHKTDYMKEITKKHDNNYKKGWKDNKDNNEEFKVIPVVTYKLLLQKIIYLFDMVFFGLTAIMLHLNSHWYIFFEIMSFFSTIIFIFIYFKYKN